ncbi:MAG TPA: hypothetical protein PK595_00115 [Bacteroidota bacterium]|jgi:hypothetical protein|nr:hypothetical protein [Bacteroidota bacterium]
MGRTVPTFTNILASELESWSKFRRGLRKEDQEIFDDIFRAAKLHLAENFYAMRAVPFESIVMSIILEQQKKIRKLENELHAQQRITEDAPNSKDSDSKLQEKTYRTVTVEQ